MKVHFRNTYGFLVCCTAAAMVLFCFGARYVRRVLDIHQAIVHTDKVMETVSEQLEHAAEEEAGFLKQMEEEYASKTRIAAMLLDNYADLQDDETILEELRVVLGAEQVAVSDCTGALIASTDFSVTGTTLDTAFLPHTAEPVFTSVNFSLEQEPPGIVAASSLGDHSGLVQIRYPAEPLLKLLQESALYAIVLHTPFYPDGTSAIVDMETGMYISHTEKEKCGQPFAYDMELFASKKGKFDMTEHQRPYLIRYQKAGQYLLFLKIPYDTLNSSANMVSGWLFAQGVFLLIVMGFAIRYKLEQQKKTAETSV